MFYIVSLKVNTGISVRTDVFVCPTKWVRKGLLYWPPQEKRILPKNQCKNWNKYKFSSNWTNYDNFRVLRNNQVFKNFEDATKAEKEELKIVTEASGTSTNESSDNEEEAVERKCKVEVSVENLINTLQPIPQILKRPLPAVAESSEAIKEAEVFYANVLNDNFISGNEIAVISTENENSVDGTSGNDDAATGFEEVTNQTQTTFLLEIASNDQIPSETVPLYLCRDPMNTGEAGSTAPSTHSNGTLAEDAVDEVLHEFLESNANGFTLTDTIATLTKIAGELVLKQVSIDKKLDNILTLLINSRATETETLEDTLNIPVSSEEDLDELNQKLNDDAFRAKMVKALCYRHVHREASLTTIILNILNNIIKDTLLINFTFSGESKTGKPFKMTDYKNIVGIFFGIFNYAARADINKYDLPINKSIRSALSSAIRHASERNDRAERNKMKDADKKKNKTNPTAV